MGHPTVGVDLAHRLQTFAYNVFSGPVKQEFENQLGKWSSYTNTIVAYARLGLMSHQEVVKSIKADQQRQAQFTMLALSILAGPALSFLSGAIQYKWAPRLFGTGNAISRKVQNPKYVPPPPTPPKPPAAPATPSVVQPPPKRPFSTHQKHQVTKAEKEKQRAERNARGYKEQNANRDTAVNNVSLPPVQPLKEITQDVFDPNFAKTFGKVFGDFGGSLAQQFLVNRAITAAQPDQTALQQHVEMVGESISLDLFESNLKTTWEEAKRVGGTAIMNLAGTVLKDREWGDKLLKQLWDDPRYPGQYAPVGQLEDFYRKQILGLVNYQRGLWANDPNWFYFGNDPVYPLKAHAVNAIEAEIWAYWIATENYRVKHYEERGGGDIVVTVVEGNSGVSIERVVQRLVQLGLIETDLNTEFARRITAKITGILDKELRDIEGKIDTIGELARINGWAMLRKARGFGGTPGYARRSVGNLDPANIPI